MSSVILKVIQKGSEKVFRTDVHDTEVVVDVSQRSVTLILGSIELTLSPRLAFLICRALARALWCGRRGI